MCREMCYLCRVKIFIELLPRNAKLMWFDRMGIYSYTMVGRRQPFSIALLLTDFSTRRIFGKALGIRNVGFLSTSNAYDVDRTFLSKARTQSILGG